jgi:hypothetical protein
MDLLGPTLARREQFGYSIMAIPGPTATALRRRTVVGLYFCADWCTACSSFTPVLTTLYTARKAQDDDQFEVVVVPRCRTAQATKHHCKDMPWLTRRP